MTAMAAHRLAAAGRLLEQAVELAPERAEYLAQYARWLSLNARDAEACALAARAAALAPHGHLTLETLAVVFSRGGAHEQAARMFEQAAGAMPNNPEYQYNLGSSLKFLGRFDEAEAAYEAAIAAEPAFHRAHSALAGLRRQTAGNNHVERLERLLACAHDVDAELHFRHALAKEYEDLGRYAEAFEALSVGRRRKREAIGYSFDVDRRLFETVESLFDAGRLAASCGADSDEPIFVVGMPRTGTTLVERILASHRDVLSAGELSNFPVCLKRAAATPSAAVLDPATLAQGVHADFRALGEAYVASTRPRTGRRPRFVDKLPLNFFYLGYIRMALPRAKIVCLHRRPLDTCIGNFRQLFATDFPHYNYAYDLNDIAEYWLHFERLMAHWDRVMPRRILRLQYERLIEAPVEETRRLLEFCGLPWQDGCLAPHASDAPVATASAVQVREPIHAGSIGRWRHYARELEPLRRRLANAGFDVA